MFKLKCKGMNYAWGQPAENSLVAKILAKNKQEIDPNKTYAEYWMGSHPNGPSSIIDNGKEIPLNTHLQKQLTYLFKVLSISKTLSIQMHPTKAFAKVLHKNHPQTYVDENHKPELFIALTDKFELLFGFKPIEKAISFIEKYKTAFESLESAKNFLQQKNNQAYEKLIAEVIHLKKEEFTKIIDELIKEKEELVIKLHEQYGYDIGVVVACFMNHFKKSKGDSMYISPNYPHAYIQGDCYEAMANSDNVIRLGLTPKFVDKENFLTVTKEHFSEMIYDESKGEKNNDFITKESDKVTKYHKPGFDDFSLLHITVNEGQPVNVTIPKESIGYCSGEITIEGNGTKAVINDCEAFFFEKEIVDAKITSSKNSELLVIYS